MAVADAIGQLSRSWGTLPVAMSMTVPRTFWGSQSFGISFAHYDDMLAAVINRAAFAGPMTGY